MRFVRLNLIISKGTSKNVDFDQKYFILLCIYFIVLNLPKSENLSIYLFSSTSNGFQMSFEFLRFTTIAFRLNTTLYETHLKYWNILFVVKSSEVRVISGLKRSCCMVKGTTRVPKIEPECECDCERNLTELCDHSMWVLILKSIEKTVLTHSFSWYRLERLFSSYLTDDHALYR